MSQTDIVPAEDTAPLPRAPLIARGETVAVVGTAFGADLADALGRTVKRIRSELMHPALEGILPETPEYERFSAAYGEIRSARQFRQLLTRCNRTFRPAEDRRLEDGRYIDPFRPGLRYAARSPQEFEVLHERHMNATRAAFRRANVVIVALSVSEVVETIADGAVLPARPADPARHRIRTLDIGQTIADIVAAVDALRMINPAIRVILTIAPEPLVETAAPVHPMVADSYGKAVLRIAMDTVAMMPGVRYFPAWELLAATGTVPGPDGAYPPEAIESVARALLELHFDAAETDGSSAAIVPTEDVIEATPLAPEVEDEEESSPDPAPTGLRATPLDPYPDAGKSRLRHRRARPAGQPLEPKSRLPVNDGDEPAPRTRRPRKHTEDAVGEDNAPTPVPARRKPAARTPEPVKASVPEPAPAPLPAPAPAPVPRRDRPPAGMFPRRPQGTLEERKAEKARRLAEFARRGALPAEPSAAPLEKPSAVDLAKPDTPKK